MNLPRWTCIPVILLTGLVLTGLSSNNSAQERERVWKLTSLEWEPYSSSKMTSGGNAIQHLRNVLARCGIELQVEFYPWRRAQQIARQPGYLGYFPAWPEEVDVGFVASPEVSSSHLAVLALADSGVVINELQQAFRDYRVGIVKSYAYPRSFQVVIDQFPASIDSGATSDHSLLKMLIAGRFQVAVTDPTVMQYLAEKDGNAEVEVVKALRDVPLVIAMRNQADNRANIQLVNRLLATSAQQQALADDVVCRMAGE